MAKKIQISNFLPTRCNIDGILELPQCMPVEHSNDYRAEISTYPAERQSKIHTLGVHRIQPATQTAADVFLQRIHEF